MIRAFKVLAPASVLTLFMVETLLVFGCYLVGVMLTPEMDPEIFVLYEDGLARIGTILGAIVTGMYLNDLYGNLRVKDRLDLVRQLCVVVGGFGFISQALVSYFNEEWVLPERVVIFGSFLTLFSLVVTRLFFNPTIENTKAAKRVLFLGYSATVAEIAAHLRGQPELGLVSIGYVDEHERGGNGSDLARLGGARDFTRVVDEAQPDWIVIADSGQMKPEWADEFLELRFGGVHTEAAGGLYESTFGRTCALDIRAADLIFSEALAPREASVRFRSLYSFAMAAMGVVITSPLMALLAVIIKLESRGPVLMKEQCAGAGARVFTAYRFRWFEGGNSGMQATSTGRVMRRYGLDALPRLFNVLRGEMAIVGPRAEREDYAERLSELIPFYAQRRSVKPGITGWEQVQARERREAGNTLEGLEYDLYYVKNGTVALDIVILVRAIKNVLLGRR